MRLLNTVFSEILNILDILHPDIYALKRCSKDDIVLCTVLSTRVKIYNVGCEIVKLLRTKKYTEADQLNVRMLRLISIHRSQIYKMAKRKYNVDLSNLRFLCELKKLFQIINC